MTSTSDLILSRLSMLSNGKDFIPLHEPIFAGNEESYVSECIRTGWVSSVGSYVDLLERNLAEYLGVRRVVVTVNGTAALHLALVAAGVTAEDEVLVPALTFVATANAVAYTGATLHFCDSAPDTLGLCPEKLAEHLAAIAVMDDEGYCLNAITRKRIKAIVPMHCMGHPVELEKLVALASRYNIIVIEDAAESLGSLYKGQHTGGFGRMGAISFNGNKIITAGGGGAIATNDEALGARLKHLSTTAKTSQGGFFFHDDVGYNYRMPNINAALCCAQLERLPEFLDIKRSIAEQYKALFDGVLDVSFISEPANTRSNYWLSSIRIKDSEAFGTVISEANHRGIMVRPLWDLMHTLPMYGQCPSMNLDIATMLSREVVSLPSSVNLTFNS
ncbi:LegC family aminotransferase [Ensifer sp. NPDC090286]|uniref:LegC family aminotransferase n=1 Tax=Ensifer sp. NPDC090286 TaxID=3363991 RepID=UPI00383B512E